MDARMCPCGTAAESRTHIAGERELYKDERDALQSLPGLVRKQEWLEGVGEGGAGGWEW